MESAISLDQKLGVMAVLFAALKQTAGFAIVNTCFILISFKFFVCCFFCW